MLWIALVVVIQAGSSRLVQEINLMPAPLKGHWSCSIWLLKLTVTTTGAVNAPKAVAAGRTSPFEPNKERW